MAIINTNPNSKDVVILQRDATNTYYGENHFSGSSLLIHINSAGDLDVDTSSSFYALYPPPVTSASTSASFSISSSYSQTASYAINAGSGTSLVTASTYPITASWALTTVFSTSSSFASNSLSASYSNSSSWSTPQLVTASFYPITSSQTIFAQSSLTSEFSLDSEFSLTASLAITSSWSAVSISSSWVNSASFSTSSSYSITSLSASYAPGNPSISASYALTASYAPSSPSISSSYALTASFAMNGGGGTSLTTGSTYPITSSYAISSSYINGVIPVTNGGTGISSLTSGRIPFGNGTSPFQSTSNLVWDNSNTRLGINTSTPVKSLEVVAQATTDGVSVRNTSGTKAGGFFSGGGNDFVMGSTTAAVVGFLANNLIEGVLGSTGGWLIGQDDFENGAYTPGTILVKNQSAYIRTLYPTHLVIEANVSQSTTNLTEWKDVSSTLLSYVNPSGQFYVPSITALNSGVNLIGTASWASQAVSASYAPSLPSISSSYALTSSYALSASYVPVSPSISASYAVSASYAPGSPSISASYALTASFALNGGGTGGTTDILMVQVFS